MRRIAEASPALTFAPGAFSFLVRYRPYALEYSDRGANDLDPLLPDGGPGVS